MKCKICNSNATIYLPAHNIAFCDEHFVQFCKKRVKKAIDKFSLISEGEKILVAISGGKDSLSLAYILHDLGYSIEGLYIDLGISKYSDISKEKAINFSQQIDMKLNILSVKDFFYGLSVYDIAKLTRRPACSICGHIKRYLLNKYGYENNFISLATGHNLDDETGVLFGNMINWQMDYLKRQNPYLPSNGKLLKKIKPLVLCSEREMAAFAIINKIDYIENECPYVGGSTYLFNKKLVNKLEAHSPGSKLRYYQGFLDNKKIFGDKQITFKACKVCGYPTTSEVCTFCTLLEKSRENIKEGD